MKKKKFLKIKKEKIMAYFMTFLMVFLMVGSILAIMIYAPSNGTKYDDYEFTQENGLYKTTIKINGQKEELSFNYLPTSLNNVRINYDAINLLRTAPFVVTTFDPEQKKEDLTYVDYARYHLAKSLKKVGEGIIKKSEDYQRLIPVTCDNSSTQTPVIYFINNYNITTPTIELNNTCVIIKGYDASLVMAENALVYAYYNIIKEE